MTNTTPGTKKNENGVKDFRKPADYMGMRMTYITIISTDGFHVCIPSKVARLIRHNFEFRVLIQIDGAFC